MAPVELALRKSQNTDDNITKAVSSLPTNLITQLDEDTTSALQRVSEAPMSTESNRNVAEILSVAEGLVADFEEDTVSLPEISSSMQTPQIDSEHTPLLSYNDLQNMMEGLMKNPKTKKKHEFVSLQVFKSSFKNGDSIDKNFTRQELQEVITPVLGKLKRSGHKFNLSSSKQAMISSLSQVLGDGSTKSSSNKSKKGKKITNPKMLAVLCKGVIAKYPKDLLSAIYAEHIFPDKRKEWYQKSPFGTLINITGLENYGNSEWFSFPEYNKVTGNYVFMILDSYHQLCGLRRLVCQAGIPQKGVKREAFQKVAIENKSNNTGLNIAMVDDMIDKQNVEFAKTAFSPRVACALKENGNTEESRLCRLIDNWYQSEDEPGIPATKRCVYRLAFRDWLLQKVNFHHFPPPGSYVHGIPLVLYEGLITNIERKIQLFTFTKRGCYNVRAVSSLDIENFFGTFQELDPRGAGVLRPDDIPSAMSVATELIDARMDPNRGFHMDTTVSKVYPCHEHSAESYKPASDVQADESTDIWRDLSSITPMDHEFDLPFRVRGKQKRKKGDVSGPDQPARGCKPVRQFHHRDESKILPHARRGLNLDNI